MGTVNINIGNLKEAYECGHCGEHNATQLSVEVSTIAAGASFLVAVFRNGLAETFCSERFYTVNDGKITVPLTQSLTKTDREKLVIEAYTEDENNEITLLAKSPVIYLLLEGSISSDDALEDEGVEGLYKELTELEAEFSNNCTALEGLMDSLEDATAAASAAAEAANTAASNVHDGTDGQDGKSAYEIAVENGFEGTKAQWLASLKGETGATGATGPQGPAGADGVTPDTGRTPLDLSDEEDENYTEDGYDVTGLPDGAYDIVGAGTLCDPAGLEDGQTIALAQGAIVIKKGYTGGSYSIAVITDNGSYYLSDGISDWESNYYITAADLENQIQSFPTAMATIVNLEDGLYYLPPTDDGGNEQSVKYKDTVNSADYYINGFVEVIDGVHYVYNLGMKFGTLTKWGTSYIKSASVSPICEDVYTKSEVDDLIAAAIADVSALIGGASS